nr:MAG TPA: intron associated endonuclease [Caudoviricetes sp.]
MYNAIQKYGWENVEHIVLYENLSFEAATEKEKELIKKYKTNCSRYGNEFGYNMTDGGEGTLGRRYCENIAQANRKRLLGKKGRECPNSRPVLCDGIEYESLTQFKEKNGYPKGNIQAWLNGEVGMPEYWYNKKLCYKDLGFDVVNRTVLPNRNRKIVIDNIVFENLYECATYLDITTSSLCLYLNNKHQPPTELIERGLRYEDEESHIFKISDKNSNPIKCTIDDLIFNSCKELADYIGRKKGTVWAWLSGHSPIPEEYKERKMKKVE